MSSACLSVLTTTKSTPFIPSRTMRLTTLLPPPPTPITLIFTTVSGAVTSSNDSSSSRPLSLVSVAYHQTIRAAHPSSGISALKSCAALSNLMVPSFVYHRTQDAQYKVHTSVFIVDLFPPQVNSKTSVFSDFFVGKGMCILHTRQFVFIRKLMVINPYQYRSGLKKLRSGRVRITVPVSLSWSRLMISSKA